jgi:hypothetical protein
LLVLWLIACVLLGRALAVGFRDRRWLGLLALGVLTALVVRPIVTRRDGFIDRSPELAIGELSRGVVGDARLVIDTDDYAFFAVMAGFQRVQQCAPLRDHDPRSQLPNPWTSPAALEARLAGADYLIAATDKLPKLANQAEIVVRTDAYALVRLGPKEP